MQEYNYKARVHPERYDELAELIETNDIESLSHDVVYLRERVQSLERIIALGRSSKDKCCPHCGSDIINGYSGSSSVTLTCTSCLAESEEFGCQEDLDAAWVKNDG